MQDIDLQKSILVKNRFAGQSYSKLERLSKLYKVTYGTYYNTRVIFIISIRLFYCNVTQFNRRCKIGTRDSQQKVAYNMKYDI